MPPAHARFLPPIRRNLDDHAARLRGTLDPDARRQAVEEVRKLRQQLAVTCLQPDARRHLLRRQLNQQKFFLERDVREGATRDQVAHVDTLLRSAASLVESGGRPDLDLALAQIKELIRLYWRHGLDQDAFCARQFGLERGNGYLARDKTAFDRSIAEGEKALAAQDYAALRNALFAIWRGQVRVADGVEGEERASLMRA